MRETRVATSTGRLPLTLRARATPAGERLTFGLFPGQSAEQLDARTEELRAAARARDVSVTRDPGRGDRVTVDVIRRDLLHAGLVLPSPWSALLPRSSPTASFPTDRRTRPPLPLRGLVMTVPRLHLPRTRRLHLPTRFLLAFLASVPTPGPHTSRR